jgi:hypothetical protein
MDNTLVKPIEGARVRVQQALLDACKAYGYLVYKACKRRRCVITKK